MDRPDNRVGGRKVNGFITINAPQNTRALTGIDPAKQQLRGLAMRPVLQQFRKRNLAGELQLGDDQFSVRSAGTGS